MRRIPITAAVLVLVPGIATAQPVDTAHARIVQEYTSDPGFLPATVASLPTHATIPSPQRHFGTIIGAPGVMHRTTEIYGYYRALAAVTPRVRVETLGRSEENREILLVTVADERLLADAGRHRDGARRLSDPRRTSRAQADSILATIKPSYYLNGGLHSPEMGSPEMLMELVYRLVVSDDPQIRAIRENVITLINPVSEPDGRDRQVDWYHRHTKHRTEWDDGFPRSSPYWGKYVYHDNNRDGIQISQALTRAIYKAYFDWMPAVSLDLHESVPLLYVSTGTGPYNETIDPITISQWQLLANHDVSTLTSLGVPGVWTWGFYDGWYPGYALWISNNHNSVGRFYETFGNAGANTYVRDLSASRYAGDSVTSVQWYRPWPPTRRVRWSARDNVNYMQAGVIASLSYAAANGETILRNFYQKGINSIERGTREAPHAFFIPESQRDPRRAAYLINQLGRHGIEVHRRGGDDSTRGHVVLLNQPYRNFAVSLLTRQNFPSSAPNPPYDDVAWTLGYLYGVDVRPVDDTAVFRWPGLTALTDTAAFTGSVRGSGTSWMLPYRAQSELLPALHWLRREAPRARAWAVKSVQVAGRDTFPAGSVALEGLPSAVAARLAERFGFDLVARDVPSPADRHALDLARVAVYHFWHSTQDEGWVRFTLDQLAIPFSSIDKDDVKRGNLRSRYDVIVVPSAGGGLSSLINEHAQRWSPLAYTRTSEFASHGTPMATNDMTGGMGFEGLAELRRFVNAGGLLITLREASRLVGESGFAPQLSSLPPGQLFHPGSVVRVKARRAGHPVLYGYPDTFHVFRGNGALLQVPRRDRGMMLLQYGTRPARDEQEPDDEGPMLGIPETASPAAAQGVPGAGEGVVPAPPERARAGTGQRGGRQPSDPYVLSGMVRNEDVIIGQGAVFDVPVGRGHVLAFTFNPLHRYLNQHDFGLVLNAILNWNDLPPAPGSAPGPN
jgi:hypothetical protein